MENGRCRDKTPLLTGCGKTHQEGPIMTVASKECQEEAAMRGSEEVQDAMFSYISAEQRVPKDHPLRPIRQILDQVLERLSPELDGMYASTGRPSIPPEKLLRALVVQALYTVRSERMLMEQLNYNLLFRWFVGLQMDDPIWDVTVFTKNRQRLLEAEVAKKFLEAVVNEARTKKLLSSE